jgi:hypothetical protein
LKNELLQRVVLWPAAMPMLTVTKNGTRRHASRIRECGMCEGAAMDDGVCADCDTLQQAALNATIRHIQAESRLTIAKLVNDRRTIRHLEPLVETLFQTRSAAVRAYQEHINTHAQKTAQSGGVLGSDSALIQHCID